MENHPHESIDTVFGCVIPYIHDSDDRNSVSLVCRKWYELDCLTRKHVTVHLAYFNSPSRLRKRFPFIESLTLQGFPDLQSLDSWSWMLNIFITHWIEEISDSYKCLKALHVRHVSVLDSDLELLARRRGKDLRHLKITKCRQFSTDGLMHIGKYCTDLKSFSLKVSGLDYRDGKWLHELALHNSSIESLDFSDMSGTNIDVNDLTLLAKNCSQSLVSFKFRDREIDLADFFSYAVRLEDCHVSKYAGFKFPPNLRCMGIFELSKSSFPFVLPFAHQLRELKIARVTLDDDSQCFLIQRCPKLEVLEAPYASGIEDKVLQVIGQFCKNLRKLKTRLRSCMGLIDVAQGCVDLECLHIKVIDIETITSEILECIGTNLKNLHDFSMVLSTYTEFETTTSSISLDNGVRLMLIGCSKLERLTIRLDYVGISGEWTPLTEVGWGYIAKYGHVLKYLYLDYVGKSDLGLVELSKGCPKLRELEILGCPLYRDNDFKWNIVFNIHSLRYMWWRGVFRSLNDMSILIIEWHGSQFNQYVRSDMLCYFTHGVAVGVFADDKPTEGSHVQSEVSKGKETNVISTPKPFNSKKRAHFCSFININSSIYVLQMVRTSTSTKASKEDGSRQGNIKETAKRYVHAAEGEGESSEECVIYINSFEEGEEI
ncbi:hypothetical protein CTI12_AA107970 [Artemisia annua]|uniref:COI1 F-box domain-containing protein n=1 Tax=Artemisia annua TaxID=35608 RepID=A0A2U1PU78_ARTAN|nr:hypothetical protein CTI12_AA107970 [Artemisia annua]